MVKRKGTWGGRQADGRLSGQAGWSDRRGSRLTGARACQTAALPPWSCHVGEQAARSGLLAPCGMG